MILVENRRNHKEFYQMVCDQGKAYDIQCICIQRCLESVLTESGHTSGVNVFYYLSKSYLLNHKNISINKIM